MHSRVKGHTVSLEHSQAEHNQAEQHLPSSRAWNRLAPLLLMALAVCASLQAATGVLLMFTYEPSARPAVNAQGLPLVLAEATRPVADSIANTRYFTGQMLLLPFDVQTQRPVVMNDSLLAALRLVRVPSGELLRPSPAYLSATLWLQQIPYGMIIRGVHHWSATVLIGLLYALAALGLLLQAYRVVPRAVWIGIGLGCGVCLVSGWTGYALLWNVRSVVSLDVVFSALHQSLIWSGLVAVLQGAPTLAPETLLRLFTLHVLVLPLCAVALFAIGRVGWSVGARHTLGQMLPTSYPAQQYKQQYKYSFGIVAVIMLFVLVLLAVLLPPDVLLSWEERLPADFSSIMPAPDGIKPAWYLLAIHALTNLVPPIVVAMIIPAIAVYWCALAWLEALVGKTASHRLLRSTVQAVNMLLILMWCALTAVGWRM